MDSGVTLEDPAVTYIDPRARIGQDTVIEPGVKIIGRTVIGRDCVIQAHSRIENSELKDGVFVGAGSVIEASLIREAAKVGPMAHIRPGSDVGCEVHIGNFVELKKTKIGDRSKAAHLTYLGDAEIGKDVNIGCGTITCNYDGVVKSKTIIEDRVFVGSDSQLVAPVKVGRGAYIGSGSTITQDVPAGALALSRAAQIHKPGWAKKKQKPKK
jgi:bifunctional UDP-N-acetylglucosamine pyrophosphorylase/glucosamine-1-phosphate N-acetyltransferase